MTTPKPLTPRQILDLPMQSNDSGAETIRGYLLELLLMVWEQGEDFSGKRPFGNSGWEKELYEALVKSGAISGTIDEWDQLEDYDDVAGDAVIAAAIPELGKA